jgi:threonine aldolase
MVDTKKVGLKAADLAGELIKRNVKVSVYGPYTIRLVTHKDVDHNGILNAISAIEDVVKKL